jgi:exodeoxyribonuclease V beta subunit
LLQARLPGYDYNTHMGGAVYVFARGIDQAGAGVWAARPPQDMVVALDAAFKEQV